MKTQWSYLELPKCYYSAHAEQRGDQWFIQIFPNRGDWVNEGWFATQEEACQAIEDFVGNRDTALTKRIYSASY